MTLLEIFFIISGVIILLFSFDIAKRQKFNALHFLVFFVIGITLLLFSFFPEILNYVGKIFGLQRGADLLVYVSIIFLIYFSLLLLNKIESNSRDLTLLIRNLAIENSSQIFINGEIVFLIRVYNEEKVLKNTIDEIIKSGYKNILVVNDGSTDNSLKILKEYGEKIIILNHLKNRGGGAALETGFEYLRRFGHDIDYVCTFDADGQHQLKDLPKFIESFNEDKDLKVVFGSRFIEKTNTNVGFIRKIILKLGILFTFFISQIKLTDSHNGYRVLKVSILNDIILTMDGMSYASEMIDIIAQKNIKFKEVPVDIIYTDYSMYKGQKSSNAINIAFKMIWIKFFR